MDPQQKKRASRKTLKLVAVVVLAAAIGGAGYVVLRNLSRVAPAKTSVVLTPLLPPDTGLVRFRRTMKRGLDRLDQRYDKYQAQAREYGLGFDSLSQACERGFVRLESLLVVLDSCTDRGERQRLKPETEACYESLKESVYGFTRVVLDSAPQPSLDSLDRELQRLLSE